jgi:hypothetical protein
MSYFLLRNKWCGRSRNVQKKKIQADKTDDVCINVTLRSFRVTVVTLEKQQLIHSLSVRL